MVSRPMGMDTVSRDAQSLNRLSGMSFKSSGRVAFVRDVHPANRPFGSSVIMLSREKAAVSSPSQLAKALSPMDSSAPGRVTSAMEAQPSKALLPIFSALSSLIFSSDAQPLNALSPISATRSRLIFSRSAQLAKALPPTFATLSARVTLVTPVRPALLAKLSGMLVTPSSKTTVVISVSLFAQGTPALKSRADWSRMVSTPLSSTDQAASPSSFPAPSGVATPTGEKPSVSKVTEPSAPMVTSSMMTTSFSWVTCTTSTSSPGFAASERVTVARTSCTSPREMSNQSRSASASPCACSSFRSISFQVLPSRSGSPSVTVSSVPAGSTTSSANTTRTLPSSVTSSSPGTMRSPASGLLSRISNVSVPAVTLSVTMSKLALAVTT